MLLQFLRSYIFTHNMSYDSLASASASTSTLVAPLAIALKSYRQNSVFRNTANVRWQEEVYDCPLEEYYTFVCSFSKSIIFLVLRSTKSGTFQYTQRQYKWNFWAEFRMKLEAFAFKASLKQVQYCSDLVSSSSSHQI